MQFALKCNNKSFYTKGIGTPLESNLILSQNNDPDHDDKSDFLTIFVYQPFIRIKHIRLNRYSHISILSRLYPLNSSYIYKGQVLDITKSFSYYNIKNENKIVLITPDMMCKENNLVNKWIKITDDQESFEERINLNINKESRKELARIKDIKFIKFEIKSKKYDKYFRTQRMNEQNSSIQQHEKKNEMNIDYGSPDSPSIEPLPVIW